MENVSLKFYLKEYEQKRALANKKAEEKKRAIYLKYPELEELDRKIASSSISSIKSILQSGDANIKDVEKNVNDTKIKRQELMKKYGISEDDFKPIFECPICNDEAFVKTEQGTDLCSCIKQKIFDDNFNKSNIYNIKNSTFDDFRLDLYSDEPNESVYKTSISPRENMIKIKKLAENFVENFDNSDTKNLLFCGNTGLGKTFLSTCIANELIKRGKSVLYVSASTMFDEIIDYKFGKTKNNLMESCLAADLLIIDDLGTETLNQLKQTEIFNVINSRLLNQNGKVTKTIISTNLSLQEIYETYEERISSRIIGNYDSCLFFGEDIRLKTLNK